MNSPDPAYRLADSINEGGHAGIGVPAGAVLGRFLPEFLRSPSNKPAGPEPGLGEPFRYHSGAAPQGNRCLKRNGHVRFTGKMGRNDRSCLRRNAVAAGRRSSAKQQSFPEQHLPVYDTDRAAACRGDLYFPGA